MLPLPSQVALLRSSATDPASAAANIVAAWRSVGPVDADALAAAAGRALAGTLICGFGAIPDPAQEAGVRLIAAGPAAVERVRFDDERAYLSWLDGLRATPLAYDGTPLCRAAVATVAGPTTAGGAAIVFRVHHGMLDGYGLTALFRRIAAEYEGVGRRTSGRDADALGELRSSAPPGVAPDAGFWSEALDGIGDPGREISFADRVAPPSDRPLRHRVTVVAPGVRRRASWPAEAVATVGAYTAAHLGTTDAVLGVTAALRRTPAERATPVQWMAVVPTRIRVGHNDSPATAGARVRRWLDAATERVRRGERPEVLRGTVPAAWRTGRTHGPIVNVLAFLDEPGWRLDVIAWGPVEDCLITVIPGTGDELTVEGVFHPDLYDGAAVRAHVEAIAALLAAALPEPGRPFADYPIPARPVEPGRIPVPGGFAVPARIRAELVRAGLGDFELREGAGLTVVLRDSDDEGLARARAVLPPGVRLRRD